MIGGIWVSSQRSGLWKRLNNKWEKRISKIALFNNH